MSITNLRQLLDPIISEAVTRAVNSYREMLLAESAAPPVKKPVARPPAAKTSAPVAVATRTRKDPRRAANEKAAATILSFITANPGLRSEQIAKGSGESPAVIKKALVKLRDNKQVHTKGEKRGMTYYATGASAHPAKKPETPKAKSAAPAPAKKRKQGTHRKKAEIAASDARVLAFVKANPGLRTEQIVKGLGGDARGDVTFSISHLRGKKKIKAKGYGRGTVYSA